MSRYGIGEILTRNIWQVSNKMDEKLKHCQMRSYFGLTLYELYRVSLHYASYFYTNRILSSSWRATSVNLTDPLLPTFSIIRCFFKATSCTSTSLLYIGSSWSSCLYSSMRKGPQEYVTYEFVPTPSVESRMSGSPNLDSFRDGWLVPLQLLLCGVLPPGLVPYLLTLR